MKQLFTTGQERIRRGRPGVLRGLLLVIAMLVPVPAAEQPAAGSVTLREPTGYWRLDDLADGGARDSCPARRHAGMRGTVAGVVGLVGGAACFPDGSAHLAGRWPQPAGAASAEAWVRLGSVPTRPTIVVGRPDGRSGLLLAAGGVPRFAVLAADGKASAADAVVPLPLGQWVQLVGTYDPAAGQVRLFVDGALAGETPYAGASGATDPRLRFGGDGTVALDGALDEVRLWEVALQPSEIAGLLAAGRAGMPLFPRLLPDRTFTSDSCPRESVPPLTAELSARILAEPVASAAVASDAAGQTRLLIAGQPATLLGGQQMLAAYAKNILHLAPYRDGGMKLTSVAVNAGFFHPDAGYPPVDAEHPPFWEGAGRYRPEGLAPDLWRALAIDPEADLLVWIWLNPYPAFAAEHPEARICNLAGEAMVVTTHFLRFDPHGPSRNPALHEQYAISFHHPGFIADAAAMCAALVREVERTVPGRRVAGYLIGGGQDGQLYDWNPPNFRLVKDPAAWGDFSPAARAAWSRWLAAHYRDPAALAAAWGRPVADFATAPVPDATDLVGTATLHEPLTGRIAYDWNRFSVEGRAHFLAQLAVAVKQAASRPVVVGVCAGDAAARKDQAQMAELLREPAIDFYLHQPTYNQRQPGLLGGINASFGSLGLHQRLFFADLDHPTWLVPDGQSGQIGDVYQDSASRGRAADPAMLAAMWRRELGWLASEGQGGLFHPILGGPWMYRDPLVVEEFRGLTRLLATARPAARDLAQVDVATVCDERAIAWLKGGLANLEWAWLRGQQDEAMAAGTAHRCYYAADLADGLLPAHQLTVLTNLLDVDAEMQRGLARLQSGGRTLVFLQGTGWVQRARGQGAAVDAAIGMQLRPLSDPLPATLAAGDATALQFTAVEWSPVESAGLRGAALLAAAPPVAAEAWRPIPDGGRAGTILTLNAAAALGVAPHDGRAVRVRGRFSLAQSETVVASAFADWWAIATIDGRSALAIDRTVPGSADRLVAGQALQLAAGTHVVEALVVSGSAGFRLALTLDRGVQPPAVRRQTLDADPQAGLYLSDPRAQVLARYPDGRPAVGIVDHGDWRAVFVGSWVLGRELLADLADVAGAWRACPPDLAVVHAGGDLLVLHALATGTLPLRLPRALAMSDVFAPSRQWPAAERHELTVTRGQTLVLRLAAP